MASVRVQGIEQWGEVVSGQGGAAAAGLPGVAAEDQRRLKLELGEALTREIGTIEEVGRNGAAGLDLHGVAAARIVRR
jgi:hypothetical protein